MPGKYPVGKSSEVSMKTQSDFHTPSNLKPK